MLRLTVGKPVQGEDFFDRQQEQSRLWDLLHNHHLLLLSPRRVGKTSLMYKLKGDAKARGLRATYLSAATTASESQFVRELYLELARQPGADKLLAELRKGTVGRFLRRVKAFKGIELRDLPEDAWSELGTELAAALRALDGQWLLLVDELPQLVLKLLRDDPSGERVRAFLLWLRSLRQGVPGQRETLHWLLAGSIGLDTLTRRLGLGDTINDLTLFHLGPFTPAVADRFLSALAESYEVTLSSAVRDRVAARAGWLIPYYLQLFFAQIRELCGDAGRAPTAADVDAVFEALLTPSNRAYFDYWSQRLKEELGTADSERAHDILTACARDAQGTTTAIIGQILAQHLTDERQRESTRRYLVDVLVSDGYLVEVEGRYRFNSPLLREAWLRSFAS